MRINPTPQKSNKRRNLTDQDYIDMHAALNERERLVDPDEILRMREVLRVRNPVRWWSLQREFKWAQKEMKRLGLNPDNARYLL